MQLRAADTMAGAPSTFKSAPRSTRKSATRILSSISAMLMGSSRVYTETCMSALISQPSAMRRARASRSSAMISLASSVSTTRSPNSRYLVMRPLLCVLTCATFPAGDAMRRLQRVSGAGRPSLRCGHAAQRVYRTQRQACLKSGAASRRTVTSSGELYARGGLGFGFRIGKRPPLAAIALNRASV